ncbi:MAG: mreC [Ferruginibacter sp.]|nr:mreC [Ferruginibacter sp.]
MFGNSANKLTGKVNQQYDRVEYYFQLKRTNDSLVKANERLYNQLKVNYDLPDSSFKAVIDTVLVDSLKQYQKYHYLHAKVISNAVSTQSNYIVLTGSNVRFFKKGMGVVDANNGAVGVITEVSGDYAVVMSLLHKDSRISGKLMKGGETGTLSWDGKEPNIVNFTGIPKSAKIAKGDTIITSGFSTYFQKGIIIGRVEEIFAEKSTSNFHIRLRTAVDFNNLEYAYAILNDHQEAVTKLLDSLKKQQ